MKKFHRPVFPPGGGKIALFPNRLVAKGYISALLNRLQLNLRLFLFDYLFLGSFPDQFLKAGRNLIHNKNATFLC